MWRGVVLVLFVGLANIVDAGYPFSDCAPTRSNGGKYFSHACQTGVWIRRTTSKEGSDCERACLLSSGEDKSYYDKDKAKKGCDVGCNDVREYRFAKSQRHGLENCVKACGTSDLLIETFQRVSCVEGCYVGVHTDYTRPEEMMKEAGRKCDDGFEGYEYEEPCKRSAYAFLEKIVDDQPMAPALLQCRWSCHGESFGSMTREYKTQVLTARYRAALDACLDACDMQLTTKMLTVDECRAQYCEQKIAPSPPSLTDGKKVPYQDPYYTKKAMNWSCNEGCGFSIKPRGIEFKNCASTCWRVFYKNDRWLCDSACREANHRGVQQCMSDYCSKAAIPQDTTRFVYGQKACHMGCKLIEGKSRTDILETPRRWTEKWDEWFTYDHARVGGKAAFVTLEDTDGTKCKGWCAAMYSEETARQGCIHSCPYDGRYCDRVAKDFTKLILMEHKNPQLPSESEQRAASGLRASLLGCVAAVSYSISEGYVFDQQFQFCKAICAHISVHAPLKLAKVDDLKKAKKYDTFLDTDVLNENQEQCEKECRIPATDVIRCTKDNLFPDYARRFRIDHNLGAALACAGRSGFLGFPAA